MTPETQCSIISYSHTISPSASITIRQNGIKTQLILIKQELEVRSMESAGGHPAVSLA